MYSFTQHLSSGSSVTCQAWWQFLSSELVGLFTAPVWTVLLAACSSPLSLDLCRVRLQLSWSIQRVRLASFLLLNDRLSGVMYFAFSSEGEKQVPATHSWGALRGDGHDVLPVRSLPPSSMLTNSSPPASLEHPVVQAEKGH